jgi:hypothetical protein
LFWFVFVLFFLLLLVFVLCSSANWSFLTRGSFRRSHSSLNLPRCGGGSCAERERDTTNKSCVCAATRAVQSLSHASCSTVAAAAASVVAQTKGGVAHIARSKNGGTICASSRDGASLRSCFVQRLMRTVCAQQLREMLRRSRAGVEGRKSRDFLSTKWKKIFRHF